LAARRSLMILLIAGIVVGVALIGLAVWSIMVLFAEAADQFDETDESLEDELVDSDSYFEMR
jgi:nitrogen fixation-related uncharacterized protein